MEKMVVFFRSSLYFSKQTWKYIYIKLPDFVQC